MTTLDQLAAQRLRDALDRLEVPADSAQARSETIAAMQGAVSKPAPSRTPPMIWFAAAAVLVVMVAVGLVSGLKRPRPLPAVAAAPSPSPSPVNSIVFAHGEVSAPATGEAWPTGRTVRTGADGSLRVKVASATLELRPNSEVTLTDHEARVHIVRGEVLADVAPSATTLSLEVGEVMISTRTARFWVSPGAGCRGQTEIRVISGEVAVTHQAVRSVVAAEERWPPVSQCAEEAPLRPPAPQPVSPEPKAPKHLTRRPVVTEAVKAPPPAPEPEPVLDGLTEQNALYAKAQTAEGEGHLNEAITLLDSMLRAYPSGPLAETALLQKIRWLRLPSPQRARQAAQQYLDQFPRGVGRAEAEELVLESQ